MIGRNFRRVAPGWWHRMLIRVSSAVIVAISFCAAPVLAQKYPTKQIRLIVPYTPGGPTDILARAVGQALTEAWGQPVIVENRPGASGNVGTAIGAKAPADGYTLNMAAYRSPSHRCSTAKRVSIRSKTWRRFRCSQRQQSARRASIAACQIGQGTDRIRENAPDAGHLRLGRSRRRAAPRRRAVQQPGRHQNDAHPVQRQRTGTHRAHRRRSHRRLYRHADLRFRTSSRASCAHSRSPAPTRSALIPELPTVAQSGLPGYAVTAWFGLLAPAGTPADIIAQINSEVVKSFKTTQMKERLAALGADPVGSTPDRVRRLPQD